jgi:hypothetical protein
MARKISAGLQAEVRERASFLCEYCHTSERWQYVRFTIDHVAADGGDSLDNLALACFHCNRRKSDKIEAVDPETGESAPLFNPRRHVWKEHFAWSDDGLRLVPQTAIGRATEVLLELNRERILLIRAADVAVNRHPPIEDLN